MSMKVMSGSNYSAHTSEMAHLQDRTPKTVSCIVHFLDDTIETFEVDVRIYVLFYKFLLFTHLFIYLLLLLLLLLLLPFNFQWSVDPLPTHTKSIVISLENDSKTSIGLLKSRAIFSIATENFINLLDFDNTNCF